MLASRLMHASGVQFQQGLKRLGVTIAPRPVISDRRLSVSAAAFEGEAPQTRTFTQFSVYKGKGAVAFKPIVPTFRQNNIRPDSPESYTGFQVDREGVLLLEFANVLPSQGNQSGYGNRNYDWSKKVTFALKAVELASLTDLDNVPVQPNAELPSVNFFHDPNKGSNNPNAVKTSKSLKLSVNPNFDGYMLSINQTLGTARTNVAVPLTRAEFVVLKHLASYLMPRLFGFDMLFEGAGAIPANMAQGSPPPQ